jgi:hypothetical protein
LYEDSHVPPFSWARSSAPPLTRQVVMPVARKVSSENPRKRGHAWARKVIALFAEDPEAGTIALDGKMLDRPHLTLARRLLGVGPA